MTIQIPHQGSAHTGGADVAEADPAIAPAPRRRRASDAPARARKADYRLRGLDLEAQAFTESVPRVERKAHPSRRRRRRRQVMQWLVVLAILAATALFLRTSVVRPYSVRSTSMVPTIQPGTNVLVVMPRLLTGSIQTGDIVVFHQLTRFTCNAAGDGSRDLVKRVVALPGQTIWSAGDRIYVNGRPLKESGWYNPPYGELGPLQIAKRTLDPGEYFVLGDNRTDPCDSRSLGPVAGSSLVGKVVATTTRNGHPHVHFF